MYCKQAFVTTKCVFQWMTIGSIYCKLFGMSCIRGSLLLTVTIITGHSLSDTVSPTWDTLLGTHLSLTHSLSIVGHSPAHSITHSSNARSLHLPTQHPLNHMLGHTTVLHPTHMLGHYHLLTHSLTHHPPTHSPAHSLTTHSLTTHSPEHSTTHHPLTNLLTLQAIETTYRNVSGKQESFQLHFKRVVD